MKNTDLVEVYSPSEQKGYRVSLGELKLFLKPKSKPKAKNNKKGKGK